MHFFHHCNSHSVVTELKRMHMINVFLFTQGRVASRSCILLGVFKVFPKTLDPLEQFLFPLGHPLLKPFATFGEFSHLSCQISEEIFYSFFFLSVGQSPFWRTKNGLHKKCTHKILPCDTAVWLVLEVSRVLLSGERKRMALLHPLALFAPCMNFWYRPCMSLQENCNFEHNTLKIGCIGTTWKFICAVYKF